MTQQVENPMELVQDTESQLWNDYMTLETRHRETWLLGHELWRKYVLTGMNHQPSYAAYDESRELARRLRDQAKVAYLAWKRVAYPLYVPKVKFKLEDEASS